MFVRHSITTLAIATLMTGFAVGATASEGISPKVGAQSLPIATQSGGRSEQVADADEEGGQASGSSLLGGTFSFGSERDQIASADFDWEPEN